MSLSKQQWPRTMPNDEVPEPKMRSRRIVMAVLPEGPGRSVVRKVETFVNSLSSDQLKKFSWSDRRVGAKSERVAGVYGVQRRCDKGDVYVGQSGHVWKRREWHRDLNGGVKPAMVVLMTDKEAVEVIDGIDGVLIDWVIASYRWEFLAAYGRDDQRRMVARAVAEATYAATRWSSTRRVLEMFGEVDARVSAVITAPVFENPFMKAVATGCWPDGSNVGQKAFAADETDRKLLLSWITGDSTFKRMAAAAGHQEWPNQGETAFTCHAAYELAGGGVPFAGFVNAVTTSAEQETFQAAVEHARGGNFVMASELAQSIKTVYEPVPRAAVEEGAGAASESNEGLRSSDYIVTETVQSRGMSLRVLAEEHGLRLCRLVGSDALVIVTPCLWPALSPRDDLPIVRLLCHARALVTTAALLRGHDSPSTARLTASLQHAYRDYGDQAGRIDLNSNGFFDMLDDDSIADQALEDDDEEEEEDDDNVDDAADPELEACLNQVPQAYDGRVPTVRALLPHLFGRLRHQPAAKLFGMLPQVVVGLKATLTDDELEGVGVACGVPEPRSIPGLFGGNVVCPGFGQRLGNCGKVNVKVMPVKVGDSTTYVCSSCTYHAPADDWIHGTKCSSCNVDPSDDGPHKVYRLPDNTGPVCHWCNRVFVAEGKPKGVFTLAEAAKRNAPLSNQICATTGCYVKFDMQIRKGKRYAVGHRMVCPNCDKIWHNAGYPGSFPSTPFTGSYRRRVPLGSICGCCSTRRLFYTNKPAELVLSPGQTEHQHQSFHKVDLIARNSSPAEVVEVCGTCYDMFQSNSLFYGNRLLVQNAQMCGWTLDEARQADVEGMNYTYLQQKMDDSRFKCTRAEDVNFCNFSRNGPHAGRALMMVNFRAVTYAEQPIHPRDVVPGGPSLYTMVICQDHRQGLLNNIEMERRRNAVFAAKRQLAVPAAGTKPELPDDAKCQGVKKNLTPCTNTTRIKYVFFLRLSRNDDPLVLCHHCVARTHLLLYAGTLEMHSSCFPTITSDVLRQLDEQTLSVTIDMKPLLEPATPITHSDPIPEIPIINVSKKKNTTPQRTITSFFNVKEPKVE